MRRLFLLACCAAAFSAVSAAQTPSSASLAAFDEVWQTINDSFYDPAFGGLDWAGVRDALRPKAAAATSLDDTRAVINEMLGRLKRSHFALLPGSGAAADGMVLNGEATVDMDVRILDGEIVITRVSRDAVNGSAFPAPGQRIVAIDGRSMTPAAGVPALAAWRRVNAALHGPEGSYAEIAVLAESGGPGSVIARVRAERQLPIGQRVQFSNLPPMRVRVDRRAIATPGGHSAGLIGFNVWMAQVDAPVTEAVDSFRHADGLIFDLRGNPGGLAAMIMGLAGQVLDRQDLLGTMRTRQVPRLSFLANPRRSMPDGRAVTPYAGPVAILVDEMTASASECFAGALQDLGRARIFGRTSMGQALPASTRRLANGDVLEFVVGDFVTSKGRSLEGSGVVPDEIQPLLIASLAAGRDDPLRAALAWIDRQSTPGRQRPALPWVGLFARLVPPAEVRAPFCAACLWHIGNEKVEFQF